MYSRTERSKSGTSETCTDQDRRLSALRRSKLDSMPPRCADAGFAIDRRAASKFRCPGRRGRSVSDLADGEGFEPSRPLRAYGISSAAPSTELGDPSATILPSTKNA